MVFSKCRYSLNDLDQFRNSEGFIDLDEVGIVLFEESREQRGLKDKWWIDFNGRKVLIKGEEEGLNGFFSELIYEELAKQAGIPTSIHDLIKFNGKIGILSPMFNDLDNGEEFDTTYSLIGQPQKTYQGGSIEEVLYDYDEIEQKLYGSISKYKDMTNEEKKQLIIDRRKQIALRLVCCEIDGHIENEGIIRYQDAEGKTKVRCAPTFDNETAFLLNSEENTIQAYVESNEAYNVLGQILRKLCDEAKCGSNINDFLTANPYYVTMLQDFQKSNPSIEKIAQILGGGAALREIAEGIYPRIVFRSEEEHDNYIYNCDFDNTLARLRDLGELSEELGEFISDLPYTLDPKAAIKSVESKIKASIPENIKSLVISFLSMRLRTLEDILYYELPCEKYTQDAKIIRKQLKMLKNELYKGDVIKAEILSRSLLEGVSLSDGVDLIMQSTQSCKNNEVIEKRNH